MLRDPKSCASIEKIVDYNYTLAVDDSVADLLKSSFVSAYNDERRLIVPWISYDRGLELLNFNKQFIKPYKHRENFDFKILINIDLDIHNNASESESMNLPTHLDNLEFNELSLVLN